MGRIDGEGYHDMFLAEIIREADLGKLSRLL
jgi:hypothetical protein